MEQFVHALFPNEQSAEGAVDALVNANFAAQNVSALVPGERSESKELSVQRKTVVGQGAAIGIVVGAAFGLVVFSALGLVSLGSLRGVLEAGLAGIAFGFFAGALGGLGYWRQVIDFPADTFNKGAVFVGVMTHPGRVGEARKVLRTAGAGRTYACSKHTAARRAGLLGVSGWSDRARSR